MLTLRCPDTKSVGGGDMCQSGPGQSTGLGEAGWSLWHYLKPVNLGERGQKGQGLGLGPVLRSARTGAASWRG